MHKSMQQFVARLSWFLAVMMTLVVMAIPAAGQAQQLAPRVSAEYPATVKLKRYESFARVFAGLADGIAPRDLEPCILLGSCPTRNILTRPASEYTSRTLPGLESEVGGATSSPAEIALQLQANGALSVRCRTEVTTANGARELHWRRTRLNEDRVRRYPWRPDRWLPSHCLSSDLRVRPGREISYTAHRRDVERRIRDFLMLHSPNDVPMDPVATNDAVRTLLPHLPSDEGSNTLPSAALLPLVHRLIWLLQTKPVPVASGQVVYRVPAGYVPVSHLESLRHNWMILCLVVIALAFIVTAFLHLRYTGRLQDLVEKWQRKFDLAQEEFSVHLRAAETAALVRGRAEGRLAAEEEFETIINFLLSAMRKVSLQVHPGTLSERVAEVFAGWGKYLAEVEDQGRQKALTESAAHEEDLRRQERESVLTVLQEEMIALFIRFGVKLTKAARPDMTSLTGVVLEGVATLQNAHNEHVRMFTVRNTMEYGDRQTQMILVAEEVVALASLLRFVLDLAPETDSRRAASPGSPKSIAIAHHVLRDEVKKRQAAEDQLANDLLVFAGELRWSVESITGQATGEMPSHPPVRDFLTPEAALREFQTAYALLFQVMGEVSRKWVDWTNPPDDIRGLVDDVLRMFSPRTSAPDELNYLDRARRAREALVESAAVLMGAPSN